MTRMTVLTTRFVAAAKPKRDGAGDAVRAEYPDAACPGLHLVVQPTGTRSWAFRFRRRTDRKSVKLTIGKAGEGGLSLAAARHAAAAHRHRLERGGDVTSVTPVTPKTEGGWGQDRDGGGPSMRDAVLAADIELEKRGRTIASIRRRDVIELVESIAVDGRGYRANRTLAALSKFFNWLVARDALAFSPVTGVEPPHKEEVRERVLSDAELRAVWLACEHDGALGQAIRMLILTGARRNEVGRMEWSEIDDRIWTLPAERSKNGCKHEVPLSSQAWALIEARPQFAGCSYVFSAQGKGPVNSWGKVKRRISTRTGITAETWRLHDLRRTAATGMQKLGVQVPVIEKALNHQSGVFRGVAGIYPRHDYADDIRIALQRWADRVDEIVGGKPAKVVKLRVR